MLQTLLDPKELRPFWQFVPFPLDPFMLLSGVSGPFTVPSGSVRIRVLGVKGPVQLNAGVAANGGLDSFNSVQALLLLLLLALLPVLILQLLPPPLPLLWPSREIVSLQWLLELIAELKLETKLLSFLDKAAFLAASATDANPFKEGR